ncbi:MAG: lipid IV(A) palmitoyltransferase PagP [Alphaproteobacteria bacterium]
MRLLFFKSILIGLCIFFPLSGQAKENKFDFLEQDIRKIYLSKDWDIYLPVNTWHNREMYDKKKTDSYNEKPWGIGVGKHIYEDDILRGLYFMVFSDSHSKAEPIAGYLRQWNYYFDRDNNFSVGAGYTLGITLRDDYNYLPIPVILPIFGFQYKKVSVQATYIPGPYNMFNVLFTWLRIEL